MTNKLLSLAAAFILIAAAAGQTADKPASVRGSVIDSVTGAPIPRVHVTLSGNSNGTQLLYGAMTTPDGKFSIDSITPARYITSAERVGYVAANLLSGPTSLTLQADDRKTDVTLKLTPTGAIAGRVTDSDGQPVEGSNVVAEGAGMTLSGNTDDQGLYRIGGLPPGRYRVRAGSNNRGQAQAREIRTDGSEEIYNAATFFPETLDAKSASRVRVGAGADASGVDICLVRSPLTHISGRVVGVPAAPEMTMVQASSGVGMNSMAVVGKDGTFELWRVDPGKWVVTAMANGRGSSGMRSAGQEVEISNSSVEGIELRMVPSADLAGRLEYDDDQAKQMPQPPPSPKGSQTAGSQATPPATATQRRIILNEVSSMNSPTGPAVVEPDDTFRLKNVPPARYRVLVTPGNVYVKSMRFGSAVMDGSVLDLSNGAAGGELSVLLSSATGTISGTIKDDNPAGTRIVLTPVDGGGRNRFAIAAADGSWTIDGLAPGSYKIVAIPESEATAVIQRGGLDDYENSLEPIEIHPGDKVTKDLKRATPR